MPASKVIQLQTVEEVYRLLRLAVTGKQPVSALYHGSYRLFCPHRLGHNRRGEPRVLCYQYGGESRSGLAHSGSVDNWRCIAVNELRQVKLLDDSWRTAPNHSRSQTCVPNVDVDAEDAPPPPESQT